MTAQRPGAGGYSFRDQLRAEFDHFLSAEQLRFADKDCLRIDLHCHDRNSDVPDELWGRLLGLPETWLKTKALVRQLRRSGCDVVTVTNHNNARSCWELMERGEDVLSAAEFTCLFPEYDLYLHVLAYGFTPAQEVAFQAKRGNVYEFVRFAAQENIPLVLPHPLYFYTRNEHIDLVLFQKLALMFQRFEVLNGQRDLWQSVLTLNWVQSLQPEQLDDWRRAHGLDPADFGVDPEKPKVLTGGSDDHMGLTAGQCGSRLYVADLDRRRATEPLSQLALEALRTGQVSPYGSVAENERLSTALLDYFVQITTHMKDPGLLRLVLHRGEASDKLACLAIGNLLLEIKHHKKTKRFVGLVHDALHGKRPGRLLKWNVSQDYQFCVRELERIAQARQTTPAEFEQTVDDAIAVLFHQLSRLSIKRLNKCFEKRGQLRIEELSAEQLTRSFELPLQLSALAYGRSPRGKNISGVNVGEILDSLSFPTLMMLVLAGAQLASANALYKNRPFLNAFAQHLGRNQHQRRGLYLTDTLRDRNGVSHSLSGKLAEIQRQDHALDFLICHENAEPDRHLHVVRPLVDFALPQYQQQPIRVPDVLEIARLFYRGGYDRVICSTEGPMVAVALFLKIMFNVPVYFFMHTDWLDFIRHTTSLNAHEQDRVRRLLRALYHQFDGVFVLNSDHKNWLTSAAMGLPESRVHLTAHHVEDHQQQPRDLTLKSSLFDDADQATPVLFVACRLSREKGILELPDIYRQARARVPDLRLVIAGVGPDEDALKQACPDALFLGWVDRQRIAQLYAGLDLFVFPSRFDTFGNVILEAFTQGMPVVSYDCKGPKDIIQHGRNGYLVDTQAAMVQAIVEHFEQRQRHADMAEAARVRVRDYAAEPIMQRFLEQLGLAAETGDVAQPAAQV